MSTKAIYRSPHSSAGPPHHGDRTGQEVEILGPLPEAEYDREETGPMFRIRFGDGTEANAFGDELRAPSLLPLANRRPVLMADTWLTRDGMGEGVVLAESHPGEWVTWHVFRHVDQTEWVAEHGDYHHDIEAAREAYNTRRQEVKRRV